MTTKKTFLVIVGVLGAMFTSCYWRNWDTLHPISPNSPILTCAVDAHTVMSYSANIQPIIHSYCATNSACHGAGATAGNDYSTYAGLQSDFSGDTTNSNAWSYLSGTPPQMPQPPNAPLSVCDKNKIRNWIHQGALNN